MLPPVNPVLFEKVSRTLDERLSQFFASAPAAGQLSGSEAVDEELFKRHTVEALLRLRLARVAGVKAFEGQLDERVPDRRFLKDLVRLGLTEREVHHSEPLLATKLLQGYLQYTLEQEGPRGWLARSFFVEYASRRTQARWDERIQRSLGEPVSPAAEEDSTTDVWNVLMTLVHGPEDEGRIDYHLNVYFGLFVAYVNELASLTRMKLTRPDATG